MEDIRTMELMEIMEEVMEATEVVMATNTIETL